VHRRLGQHPSTPTTGHWAAMVAGLHNVADSLLASPCTGQSFLASHSSYQFAPLTEQLLLVLAVGGAAGRCLTEEAGLRVVFHTRSGASYVCLSDTYDIYCKLQLFFPHTRKLVLLRRR
jgi:hypothetical protein